METISLVIITEKGRLEAESKLLIDSIRQFGGRFKDVPIYSYQPRKGYRISKETLDFFQKNQVNYVDIPLNTVHENYPFANKLYVCAHAEQQLKSETIIFMDSDSVVWQEPKAFYEVDNVDVAMTPVFRKFNLAVNKKDENYAYWQRMQTVLGFSTPKTIQTLVDNQQVLAYYNSGLIVAKRSAGFYQNVKINFEKLLKTDASFFHNAHLEQVNLSATIHAGNFKFQQLPKGYNYPLKHHGHVQNLSYRVETLDEVITGHYTVLFKKAGYKNPLKGKLIEGEKGEWFKNKVKEYGVYQPWYKKLINAV